MLLDRAGGKFGIGGNRINITLQRVRSRLLDEPGILGPATDGGAVEAGNDGHRYCLLGPADVIQIALRSQPELIGLREETYRLRKTVRSFSQMVFQFEAFLPQLLLEQRIQHNGGCARILELANAIDLLG